MSLPFGKGIPRQNNCPARLRPFVVLLTIENNQPKNIMSESKDKGYMLIFRGTDWCKGLSAEETQQVTSSWMAWANRLIEQGKLTTGKPLEPEGRIVSGKNGRVVSDGPFLESKEAIGGFFMLQVDTMDEAVAIAKECPGLPHGIQVEVRQLAEECPIQRMLKAEGQLAHA
jgi:hypothetical protein